MKLFKKAIPAIFITLLVLVLVVIHYYPQIKERWTDKKTQEVIEKQVESTLENEKDNKKHRLDRNPIEPGKMEVPPEEMKEMANKYPDKFEILRKMYYSLDYIDNAEGKYEQGRPGDSYQVQFSVDFINNKNKVQKEIIKGDKVIERENILANVKDEVLIRQLPQKNVHNIMNKKNQPFPTVIADSIRSGNKEILQTEWNVLLYDLTSWSYKEEMKYNMQVYQLEGIIPKGISDYYEGSFSMTISKDTGALLDFKSYKNDKTIKFFTTVSEIKLNKGIANEEKVFQLDISNSKELPWEEYYKMTIGGDSEIIKK